MKRSAGLFAPIVLASTFLPLPSIAQDAPPVAAEPAADSAYSIIPSDVFFALAVRSYKDLKAGGDKLIEESKITPPIRPSFAIEWLFSSLKVLNGLDEDAPFAVMLTGEDLWDDPEEAIVYAVPFSDMAAMAANFGRKPEDFEEGKPIDNLGKNALGVKFSQVALRGRWFFVGSKKSVARVLAMRSVEETLSPDQRKLLPKADIVLHFARAGVEDDWEKNIVEEIREAAEDDGDERLKRLGTILLPLAKNFRLGEIAIRVDEGLALHGFSLFDPSDEVTEALDTLSGGSGASHLTALPEGPVVFAYGATGDGRVNGDLARDFLSLATDDFFGRQGREASVDRKALFGIFDEVWNSLRGSRGALYENREPEKHGLYSAVSILDTDDAAAFLARIEDLALYVNHASDQLEDGAEPPVDDAKLDLLVKDLAAADFRVRTEASTRLALLGDAALPALRKAMDSDDPEVRMRASALHNRLEKLGYKHGRDLIKGDVFAEIRPRFVFFPGAEKRGKYSVDIAQLTLGGDSAGSEDALAGIFGPEWKKLRLVKKGDQVVFLAGTNTELLDDTLANLDAETPGVEGSDSLESYRERSVPVRKAELHTAMAKVIPLIAPGGFPKPEAPEAAAKVTPPLTSAGLSVQPFSLAFDLFFPPSELGLYFNLWIGM